jgi:hypothetical protein
MSSAEYLATLKYTFDLRNDNNRSPFMFGAHTDLYDNDDGRKGALEDFLDYVLAKDDVRVVPIADILDWCKDPKPLK